MAAEDNPDPRGVKRTRARPQLEFNRQLEMCISPHHRIRALWASQPLRFPFEELFQIHRLMPDVQFITLAAIAVGRVSTPKRGFLMRKIPPSLLAVLGLAIVALAPGQSRAANLTPLVSFNGANGANPYAGLIADANGNLFGTTASEHHGDDSALPSLVLRGNLSLDIWSSDEQGQGHARVDPQIPEWRLFLRRRGL
jgi:hypothetical protein